MAAAGGAGKSGFLRLFESVGKLGTVLVVGGVAYNSVLYNVDAGHRAVIYDQFQGIKEDVIKGEGTHALVPWVQKPIIFDVRTRPRLFNQNTGSKDMQHVSITLRILFRPVVSKLPVLFKEYGRDYDERILNSIANEVLTSVVAQYDAAELITQREKVSEKVQSALRERASHFHIILDDISLTHLTFGKDFAQAVELKQIEQQKAERARFIVEKAEQEQLAEVIRAEGDSRAAELISQALIKNGPGLVELKKIDAAVEIAQTLSRSRTVTYLPSNNNILMNMALPN